MGYVIYIFHRDLRLADNRTLEAATQVARDSGRTVLPVFIFTQAQVTDANPYKSMNSIQFMIESLEDLAAEIEAGGGHLTFLFGQDAISELSKVLSAEELASSHIFETADYTPFAKKRQQDTHNFANFHGAEYTLVHDTYLTVPGSVLTGTGRPYQKFTPFYNAARQRRVEEPRSKPRSIPWAPAHPKGLTLATIKRRIGLRENPHIHVHGGRTEGLKLLRRIPDNYADIHDIPSERTTDLSAHHHFGTISVRETFAAARGQEMLTRQLYWRDFYGHICDAFEDLYGVDPYEYAPEGEGDWSYNKAVFRAWCEGKTGVPIVDAAMHQMAATGYMHNRARLIVANYLVKDLKIYWRWGERFFAQHLVDYDFAQNFGNWAWVASVLPFSQAPFRRLDPTRQSERFDKKGVYVKRWLPAAAAAGAGSS